MHHYKTRQTTYISWQYIFNRFSGSNPTPICQLAGNLAGCRTCPVENTVVLSQRCQSTLIKILNILMKGNQNIKLQNHTNLQFSMENARALQYILSYDTSTAKSTQSLVAKVLSAANTKQQKQKDFSIMDFDNYNVCFF